MIENDYKINDRTRLFLGLAMGSRNKLLVMCLFGSLLYFYAYKIEWIEQKFKNLETMNNSTSMKNATVPVVLLWTEFFDKKLSNIMPLNFTCPYKCHYTYDRSLDSTADARIFHVRNWDYTDLPVENPDALNVFFTLESPINSQFHKTPPKPKLYANYFNLTMTYRSNADIYFPYDTFVEISGNETADEVWTSKEIERHIKQKTKHALVAVSNCFIVNSGRIDYTRALSSYLNVTQVGNCNYKRCDGECLNKLIDKHYFYLAFENSLCPEYTTEKFWRIKKLIVPVVLSRAAMSPHIPPDSYIAASDFESPEKLADYLIELSKNKKKYKSYFNWTNKYKRTPYKHQKQKPLCHLCKILHEGPKQIRNYRNEWSHNECIYDYGKHLLKKDSFAIESEIKMANLIGKTAQKRDVGRV